MTGYGVTSRTHSHHAYFYLDRNPENVGFMMAFPKVTIAIPVYNGANYLSTAIDSALEQTYSNVEIIVVNDGSSDQGATEAVAQRYLGKIKYIAQENKGVSGAMNTAIAHMTGDIFTWLSHDDIYLPEKTEAQVNYFNKIGRNDVILFSDYYLINEDGEIWHESKLPYDTYVKTPMLPLLRGQINGCTLFVPAHILREFGPFDEQLRYVQDYELWNKILSRYEFFLQSQPLLKYRIHPAQGTNRPEAAIEGDALWIRMIDSRCETERVQLSGSGKRFLEEMADHLDHTPYKKAAKTVRDRVKTVIENTLVSVVIPFFNENECLMRAVQSVLAQTHKRFEVILVNDGSTDDLGMIEALARCDPRIRLISQRNSGPGAARNNGISAAAGEYIAFLDADDVFVPGKITWQLGIMQDTGSVFSHTSYHVWFPEYFSRFGTVRSGNFSGKVYPEIIAGCPIATPTVMIHRSLVAEGFEFPSDTEVGEDVLAWWWISLRHSLAGIDEPLSLVEWSRSSACLRMEKAQRALRYLTSHARSDPVYSRAAAEIQRLEDMLRSMERMCDSALAQSITDPELPFILRDVIDHGFGQGASVEVTRLNGSRGSNRSGEAGLKCSVMT